MHSQGHINRTTHMAVIQGAPCAAQMITGWAFTLANQAAQAPGVVVAQARDLTRMEGLVLQSLEFRVNTPTCYTFLSLLNQHLGPSPAHVALSVYLLVRSGPPGSPLVYNRLHLHGPYKAAPGVSSYGLQAGFAKQISKK